ncbi:MAG: cbb3-type cytochrome c oxidase subunit I [Gammaproteobacteria bacterium]|nr:cbb3-type cytochrome c oxidase subunit I [Gammaproteobacteria bacterium]MCF6362513.1 cbb3-type cytochrome c oxidase subunit I [Gammaproteobacteria bacterium]
MSKNYSYVLPEPDEELRRLSAGWLILGIAALVAAGLLAILLVMARTPYIKDIFPWDNFFKTAMVVHVDLSVLMWFLPCAGIIWSYNSTRRYLKTGWAALWLASIGTVIVAVSPFIGSGEPLMNNYFPVIDSPVFLSGMVLFGVGFTLLVMRSLSLGCSPIGPLNSGTAGLRIGIYTASISSIAAVGALIWAYFLIPDSVQGWEYYEVLFWGSGHVLQFTHTLLMIVVWLWLASVGGVRLTLSPRLTSIIFGLGVVTILVTPYIYLSIDIMSVESAVWFTRLMTAGGGLAALPFGLVVIIGMYLAGPPSAQDRVLRMTLFYSLLLFGVGGVLGFMIRESSTLITAHYHGSNGAITVAFMGMVYFLLPKIGFDKVQMRLARIQVHAFGLGQLLHVLGLAWAGGYGMQRKISGEGQSLDNFQQTAGMAIMGIGGLIAVIGGVLFLYLVVRAMWPKKHQTSV